MSATKGTRLTEDWQPGPEYISFAVDNGFTAHEARRMAEEFRDYWIGVSGQKGVKANWLATWRNRVRAEAKRQDRQPKQEPVDVGEPLHAEPQRWQKATGRQGEMFQRMSAHGCPDDILDQLYTEGCGICDPDNERPTAVFRTGKFHEIWHRAASGYAQRAGYNRVCWHHGFYQYYRKKQEDIRNGVKRVVSGQWVNDEPDQSPDPEPTGRAQSDLQSEAQMASDQQV